MMGPVHAIICPDIDVHHQLWTFKFKTFPTLQWAASDCQALPEVAAHLEFNHLCLSGKEENHREDLLTQ